MFESLPSVPVPSVFFLSFVPGTSLGTAGEAGEETISYFSSGDGILVFSSSDYQLKLKRGFHFRNEVIGPPLEKS